MAARRDSFEAQHLRNLAKYNKQIGIFYAQACREAGVSAATLEALVKAAGPGANFAKIPAVRKVLDKIQKKLSKNLEASVVNGIKTEWKLANSKYDALIGTMAAGDLMDKMEEEQRQKMMAQNIAVRDAFIARKEGGLNLSQRVWNYTGQMRDAMEIALEVGIWEGQSAAEIARELKQYLKYPDKLFRRVRDKETGELKLSEPASLFHPGQGVYRSSYQNALRLARTETNIAYRKADTVRRQGLYFVVGIEVHLSNNHNCKGIPEGEFHDICDELQGKYPPYFDFSGWHPACRCWTSTILQTDEEFIRDSDGKYRGSVNEVKDVPPAFKDWVDKNRDRIDHAAEDGKLAYFLRDNRWAWDENAEKPEKETAPTSLLLSEERHAARTEEQVKEIKERWEWRKRALKNYRNAMAIVESIPGMKEYLKQYASPATYNTFFGEKPIKGNYNSLDMASRFIVREISDLKKQYSFLEKPLAVFKEFGVEKTMEAGKAISNKIDYIRSNYASLEKQLDKFRFEAQWIEDNKKGIISTWEVAKNAYLKAARETEFEIEWGDIKRQLADLAKSKFADPAMVADVRSYIGHDKDEAEYELSHLRDYIQINELREQWESFLAEAPQVFLQELRNEVETAFSEGDVNDIRYQVKTATVIFNHYKALKTDAETVLQGVKDAKVAEKLRNAIANEGIAGLSDAIALGEREQKFQLALFDANVLLNTARPFLEKIAPVKLKNLEAVMTPKDYTEEEVKFLQSAYIALKKEWEEWQAMVQSLNELSKYQTSSKEYKALLDIAQNAVNEVKPTLLETTLAKLEAKRDELEKVRAHDAAVRAEWDKMKEDVEKIAGKANSDKDLLAKMANDGVLQLIFAFRDNASGPKKLTDARTLYRQIVDRAKRLGISLYGERENGIKFGEDAFTKKRKDNAVWDTPERAKKEKQEHGKLADDTLFKDASAAWKASIERENRVKELIARLQAKQISKAQFEAIVASEGLDVYSYVQNGVTHYMTEREAIYEYTHHYCDVNEPLEGRRYMNSQNVERFFAKVNAITNIIGTSKTPKDMWFQRGDSNMDVIFSRLRFAGTDFESKLESLANISGNDIDDKVIDELQSLVGKTMQEGGFMSMGSAKNKGFTEGPSKRVILNIYAPQGTRALYAEHFSDFGSGVMSASWDGEYAARSFSKEFETLAQRGTIMRITRVQKGRYKERGYDMDIIYIDVEIVAQDPKDISGIDKNLIGY